MKRRQINVVFTAILLGPLPAALDPTEPGDRARTDIAGELTGERNHRLPA